MRVDHKGMLEQFDDIRLLLTNIGVQTLKENNSMVVDKINSLCDLIEMHVGRESSTLQLLSNAFQGAE
jgi:hypothetical protein